MSGLTERQREALREYIATSTEALAKMTAALDGLAEVVADE